MKIEDIPELDIAWLSGLWEGEGSFAVRKRCKNYKTSTTPGGVEMKIAMTDEDVIAKVSELVGKPYFIPNRKTVKGKTVYQLSIGKRENVIPLVKRIIPYLGKRRKEQAEKLLENQLLWEEWYNNGGRSDMAKVAYGARLEKYGTCGGGNPTGINQYKKHQ
jgi:hypothetical protein